MALRLTRRRLVTIGAVIVAAGVLLAAETHRRQARLNRLIEEITASDGFVMVETPHWLRYVSSWRRHMWMPKTQVCLSGPTFDDHWLREHDDLAALEIDDLMLDHCSMTADGLRGVISRHPIQYFAAYSIADCDSIAALLSDKRSLSCARFSKTDLSDAGLRSLPLETLVVVPVDGTRVTPGGLGELRRCRQLNSVSLDGSQFDDSVAELLASADRYFVLCLVGRDVTDGHLKRVHAMNNGHVWLTDTSVTAQGVAALKAARPDCRVRIDSTTPTIQSNQ